MSSSLSSVLDAVRKGTPVVLLDNPQREGEADLILHAKFCTPQNIRLLRISAGGLVCLGTDTASAQALGVPYAADILRESRSPTLRALALGKAPYGDPSAFSIWINHKKTFTGITDQDRSKTIMEFEKMIDGAENEKQMASAFIQNFYSPGHVPLLIARSLEERKGHTELCLSLAKQAGMSPAMVMCEMLGEDWKALEWKKAQALAKKMGWPAVQGEEII
ncbi:3,4-dihydroxy-2-butanone 4-phosphate synthase [uncultured archaeon]|nr:3,4-dihydroxy-2-butanone 4-phosphate synthase [uncultured archaeon]